MFLGSKKLELSLFLASACLGVMKITPLFPGGMSPAAAGRSEVAAWRGEAGLPLHLGTTSNIL